VSPAAEFLAGGAMSSKAYFGRRYMLSASHRLHVDSLSDEENRVVYGKCNNPYGHGHNYTIEVLTRGRVDASTGMVVNLVDLDLAVRTSVVERFDHTHLNNDELFANCVPTTENLCRAVYELLADALPDVELEHVRVEETENNFFQYSGK
jgi:6-pyruvoyltetrahydropterin/6-carboxytetrahydropterin synthase